MLTIISTALGFFTSLVPNVLDYFKQKRDQDHELAMIDAQTQAQLAIGQMQLEATVTDAQLKEIQAAHKEQASTAVAAGRLFLACPPVLGRWSRIFLSWSSWPSIGPLHG